MPGEIRFTLNGNITTYRGNPSARLLDVLRGELGMTGTKCGCKEGECGACAVLIDGRLINSCLVAVGSLHSLNVMTIEGYSKTARFAALDKAYASASAVQCGFCIPGMMLASESILDANPHPTEEEIRTGISGNLCRCTGYNAIVKAIGNAAAELSEAEDISGDCGFLSQAQDRLRSAMTDGTEQGNGACISARQTGESVVSEAYDTPVSHAPRTLREALLLRKETELVPYVGGTDLMVSHYCDEAAYLFLNRVAEMRQITSDDTFIRFGAACTFTEAIEHPLTPAILREACSQVAAPAIRNAGTLGGNVANGSAKADSALIFMVTDSLLRLVRADGERILPIKEFYLGRGKTALESDELLVEILMPKQGLDSYYYKKVGARNALSIARTSFAGILDVQDGVIENCAVAFGAVIDVIIRYSDIDRMLIGKTVEEARELKGAYIAAYDEAIVPRRGRVSIEYRKDVCMNLLRDFLETLL